MFEGARLGPSVSPVQVRVISPESCAAVFFSHVQGIQVMLL